MREFITNIIKDINKVPAAWQRIPCMYAIIKVKSRIAVGYYGKTNLFIFIILEVAGEPVKTTWKEKYKLSRSLHRWYKKTAEAAFNNVNIFHYDERV